MSKSGNGNVQWRWLGPAIFLIAFGLLSWIGSGVSTKVDAHETRIQQMDRTLAVQQEILARIETKIDSLIKKMEKRNG